MNRPLSFLATLAASWAVCAVASAQSPSADSPEAVAPNSASEVEPIGQNEGKKPSEKGEVTERAAEAGEGSKQTESKTTNKPPEPGAVPVAPGLPPGAGTAVKAPSPAADGSPKSLPETTGSSMASPAIVLPHDAEAIESKPESAFSPVSDNRVGQGGAPPVKSPGPMPAAAPPSVQPEPRQPGEPRADTGGGKSPAELPAVVGAWVGLGTTIMRSDVFDPFSTEDALSGVALGASLAPPGLLPSGFTVVGAWQYASTEASWRGEATSYAAQRFSLGVEVGSELLPRIDYYLRVSAAAVFAHAQLEESSSGVTLEDRLWAVGAEGVAGLQWRIARIETKGSRSVKIFARVEGGLLWLPDRQVKLSARGGAGPVRLSAVRLGDLNMGGDQLRFALGWSY